MQAVEWISNLIQIATARFRTYFHCEEKPTIFTEEELMEYQALTHLTKEEILRAYGNFCNLEPRYIVVGEKNPLLTKDQVLNMPEFQVNPFKHRMLKVFGTSEDYFSFEDYLDMMSVLSKNAPIALKAEYAFQIYDFDDDDLISIEDLKNVMKLLNSEREMGGSEMKEIAIKVLMDGDVDEDGCLAFTEFLHLVGRLKDFKSSFTIHL